MILPWFLRFSQKCAVFFTIFAVIFYCPYSLKVRLKSLWSCSLLSTPHSTAVFFNLFLWGGTFCDKFDCSQNHMYWYCAWSQTSKAMMTSNDLLMNVTVIMITNYIHKQQRLYSCEPVLGDFACGTRGWHVPQCPIAGEANASVPLG